MAKKKTNDAGDVTAASAGPTFRLTDGSDVVAHDDYAADLEKGINLPQLKDPSGRWYSHVDDDTDGRWLYRAGH